MNFEFLDCMALSHFLLVQPSSAAAEKVFSTLQRFTARQQSSLEYYLELSVMFNTTLLIRFSNLCLHLNYSMQKKEFLESKMGESEKQNR